MKIRNLSGYAETPRQFLFRVAGGPVLLLLIVAGFYWKMTLSREFDWMWNPDLSQQVLP